MIKYYRCLECGLVVEIINEANIPECCGSAMIPLAPNTVDAASEKHVPVINYHPEGVTVKIGSEPHPMEETHFIEWIEIYYDSRREKLYLKPGQAPEAIFNTMSKNVRAYGYCNLHGLWVSEPGNEK